MSGPADAAVLQRWWAQCRAGGGCLPRDVQPVQTRLVRAVGRAALPDAGPVFVKVMGFPRRADRIRYLFRALPARHEARMLAWARRCAVRCPVVVWRGTARRRGLPAASMLVTAALPTAERAVTALEAVRLASDLIAAGIFHPDLNSGNFVAVVGGEVAVLDLQSARRRRAGLGRRLRVRMLSKLIASVAGAEDALAAGGVAAAGEIAAACRQVVRLQAAEPVRRIRRCLRESTEFVVRRRRGGREFRRRAAPDGGAWISGGHELVRWWIGDRALEVLDGRPPVLGALFRKSWWLPGRCSVYLLPNGHAELPREAPALQEGFERYQTMKERWCPVTVEGARR